MKFLHQYLSKSKSPGLSKTRIIRSKPAQAKQITEQSKAQPEDILSSFFTVSGSGKCDDKWQVTFTSCQGDKRTDRGPGSWELTAHRRDRGPLSYQCVWMWHLAGLHRAICNIKHFEPDLQEDLWYEDLLSYQCCQIWFFTQSQRYELLCEIFDLEILENNFLLGMWAGHRVGETEGGGRQTINPVLNWRGKPALFLGFCLL